MKNLKTLEELAKITGTFVDGKVFLGTYDKYGAEEFLMCDSTSRKWARCPNGKEIIPYPGRNDEIEVIGFLHIEEFSDIVMNYKSEYPRTMSRDARWVFFPSGFDIATLDGDYIDPEGVTFNGEGSEFIDMDSRGSTDKKVVNISYRLLISGREIETTLRI